MPSVYYSTYNFGYQVKRVLQISGKNVGQWDNLTCISATFDHNLFIKIKHVNCYLVKVNEFYIAIDTGWRGHINEYMNGLQQHNIKPEKIKYLFITHFHPDRAGLIENIKKFGTSFVVFEHQIPYVEIMEKMIKKDGFYLPLNIHTNVVVSVLLITILSNIISSYWRFRKLKLGK